MLKQSQICPTKSIKTVEKIQAVLLSPFNKFLYSVKLHFEPKIYRMAGTVGNLQMSFFDANVQKIVIRSLFLTYDTDSNDQLDKEELGKLFERDWA